MRWAFLPRHLSTRHVTKGLSHSYAEIVRKQKDAQMKQVAASSIVQQQRRIDEQDVEGELRKARAQGDQLNALRSELAEQVSC